MSQSSSEVIAGLYAAFGRGDVPAILERIAEDIDWRVPENLPHGGDFAGREAVGRFFEGIGEHWEGLNVEIEDLISSGERVVALCQIHGRLRSVGTDTGYRSVHSWIVRDGTPIRFAEYVDAPLTLPAAQTVTG